jgi:hypothetical protein
MKYPYQPHQIVEILDKPKCLPEGETLEIESAKGSVKGRQFDTKPELIDGPFVPMRYLGKAPVVNDTKTFDASFLIAGHRVRGIGYNEVARNNLRFKQRIPKGWHLNICDPNLPTNDPKQNIHEPLPGFSVSEFKDFIEKTARQWKIDLGWQWEVDLFS